MAQVPESGAVEAPELATLVIGDGALGARGEQLGPPARRGLQGRGGLQGGQQGSLKVVSETNS